jgi:hypothetical protein
MNDEKCARDYNIEGGSVLHLVRTATMGSALLLCKQDWQHVVHNICTTQLTRPTPCPVLPLPFPQVLALRGGSNA